MKIEEFFMIRELYQKGWTQTAIAKETGFDQKTIHKYLKEDKLPGGKANKKKKENSILIKTIFLTNTRRDRTTNCVVLLEEIQAMGYKQIGIYPT